MKFFLFTIIAGVIACLFIMFFHHSKKIKPTLVPPSLPAQENVLDEAPVIAVESNLEVRGWR